METAFIEACENGDTTTVISLLSLEGEQLFLVFVEHSK